MRLLATFVLCLLTLAPAIGQTQDYQAGQIWAYKTAPGDEGSLIKIQEVEWIGPDGSSEVFHISMTGVQVPWQDVPLVIQHLPVSRETLDTSVTRLIENAESLDAQFPDHSQGKAMWEEANGGVFTITLAEVADFLRNQFRPPTETNKGKAN